MAKHKSKGGRGFNRNLSEAFLLKYQQQDDVIQTETGLLYRIIQGSDGQRPEGKSAVKVHQRILLADNSLVDDTYKSGMPESFSLDEAIDGLSEGLQLMTTGARYEFVIPPELAWGRKGNGGSVGPNAVMICDMKLLAFE